jgi:hypothetical protein
MESAAGTTPQPPLLVNNHRSPREPLPIYFACNIPSRTAFFAALEFLSLSALFFSRNISLLHHSIHLSFIRSTILALNMADSEKYEVLGKIGIHPFSCFAEPDD